MAIARSMGDESVMLAFDNKTYRTSSTNVIKPANNFCANPPFMSTGERIKQARMARGWSQARLAKEVGITQPAIKKIEAGETRKSKFIPDIEATLELVPNPGKLPDTGAKIPVETSRANGTIRNLPVYASTERDDGALAVSSDAVDYVERPAPLAAVKNAYGLLVVGETMAPAFEPGDTVLIHPHKPITANCDVVLYAESEGGQRATIKRLRRFTATMWHLTQWNPPDGQRRDFTLPRKEWTKCHRIIGKYSR